MAAALTVRHQLALLRAGQLIERRAARTLRRADTIDIDSWWLANQDLLVQLAAQGFALTASMAARYLIEHAGSEGATVRPVRVAPNREQIEASLWATGPVAFKQHLTQSGSVEAATAMMRKRAAAAVTRQALGGARKMTMATVAGQPVIVGHRRVARPGACKFCEMLAGRGAVYKSRQSAGLVAGRAGRPRGTQRIGASFHDNCNCVVEPLYRIAA